MKYIIVSIGFFLAASNAYAASLTPTNVVAEINRVRAERGLHSLNEVPPLDDAALAKAREIARIGALEHTPVQEGKPWPFLAREGYEYEKGAEILALYIKTAEDLVQAWMDSPSHRAALVSQEYTEIGIGIAEGSYSGVSANFAAGYLAVPRTEAEPQVAGAMTENERLIVLLRQLIAVYQMLLARLQG